MDEIFMALAIKEAKKAAACDEVPVGAVLVRDGILLASAYNIKESSNNPLGHAEILLISQASKMLNTWRLSETTLYVTLEPCPMCAGAMVQARISRCVFGAYDPKSGAAGSVCDLLRNPLLNHQLEVSGGVLAGECGGLLKDFFARKRKAQ